MAHVDASCCRRFVDKAASFGYLEYGSDDTYALSFRVVPFELSDNTYECLVTNLPSGQLTAKDIQAKYGVY